MKITKEIILSVFLLSLVGLTAIPHWIPSFDIVIPIAANIISIYIGFSIFKILHFLHIKRKTKISKVKNTSITIVSAFFSYAVIVLVLFINLLSFSSFMGGTLIKKETINNKVYYVSDIGFIDKIIEVRIKNKYLPITHFVLEEYPCVKQVFTTKGDSIFFNNQKIFP